MNRWKTFFGRSFRDRDPVTIAVVTIPVLAAMVIAAYAYGTAGFLRGGYTVSGVFAATGGIEEGAEVRLAGVKVGEVTGISPDFGQGHIVISWSVDSGVELGSRMHADIRLSNLLGGHFLRLSGPVAEPYLHARPDDRRRIPLERTSVPYSLNTALGSASDLVGRLDSESIDRLLAEAAKVELPEQREMGRLLADLRKVGATLNDSWPQIAAVIENGERLTGMLAAKDRQLAQLLEHGESLLEELARRRDSLASTLGSGSRVVESLDEVLDEHEKELNTVLDDFHLTMETVTGENLPSMNVALAWFGPAFFDMSTAGSREGRWMEGGFVGFGPVQPGIVGPQPNFNSPNYPQVPTGQVTE